MSRKLIKYEFKQLKSALLLTAIALAVITGIIFCVVIVPMLVFGMNDSAEGILSIFLAYITFILYVVILIVTGIGMNIYIGVRFYKTMYSGVGYFTNTLPLKKHEIILGKVIPAVVVQTIVTLMVVVSASIILGGYILVTDGFGDLMLYIARFKGAVLGDFTMLTGMGIVLGIVFGCLFAIIQTVFNTLLLFLAVSIGQLFNSNKILMSVIIFIVMNRVFNAVDTIIEVITKAFVYGPFIHSPSIYSVITMILISAKNIIIAVIAYLISYRILRYKLNLE